MIKSFFLYFGMTMFFSVSFASNTQIDSLLLVLDEVISNRPSLLKKKQATINALKHRSEEASTIEERFKVLSDLENEYHYFNIDSAMIVLQWQQNLVKELNKQEYIDKVSIDLANVLAVAAMYKEAVDTLRNIRLEKLAPNLRRDYFHTCRTLYGLMADYATTLGTRKFYSQLEARYKDSLLIECKDDEYLSALIGADAFNDNKEYDKAIRVLSSYLRKGVDDDHTIAFCAYTLSESYRLNGERKEQKKQLILSAISDMKAVVREYISLRKLAVMLYEEGDINRAYSYVKICLEDATACNARLRKLEILEVFPVINATYQKKEEKQKTQMGWALFFISLLSVFLFVALLYIYKIMKRVAASRREIRKLNKEILQVNKRLKEANHNIAENSYLKDAYIGRYMDRCSAYLEKMNEYRRSLSKIAVVGNVEELYKSIKSTKFIDEELKDFYANFDNTFLQLFPTFIEDFNALLAEDKRIYPKQGERMNTELRIYALIRLGITDSVKIAQILRYSVTTIYNYRVKVRNRSLGTRDSLENEIMKIGKIRSDC